jgi:glyoxylase-like metal-dependent hydrolase (beta-lactamase superfamily II)
MSVPNLFLLSLALLATGPHAATRTAVAPAPHAVLHVETYVADSSAFSVVSTIISGPTEAILVDAQFHLSDANRVADLIAAKGVRLKAVVFTHPHDDHYIAALAFRQRFPGVPFYISEAGLKEYARTAPRFLGAIKAMFPADTPDTLVRPQVFPSSTLTIDGEPIEIVPDLTGDQWGASNSYLWIPSLRAAVVGDLAFNGVHAWLANSTVKSRANWLKSLDQLIARKPAIVVAGHKRTQSLADSPDVLVATQNYLREFDKAADVATGSDDLIARMRAKYPELGLAALILARSARVAIPD